jgi:formylmethanofuran dehydrogenase subunit E
MAKTSKIVDGQLILTDTGNVEITTMTRKEVEGKRAEVQTEIDHLNINLTAKQTEWQEWDDYLTEIDNKLEVINK